MDSNKNSVLISSAVLSSLLFSILFVWYVPGFTALGFVILNLLITTGMVLSRGVKKLNPLTIVPLVLELFIAATFAYRYSSSLKALLLIALPFIHITFVYSLAYTGKFSLTSLFDFLITPLYVLFGFIEDLLKVLFKGTKGFLTSSETRKSSASIIVGLLLSVPIAIVLLSLLAQADTLFSDVISGLLSSIFDITGGIVRIISQVIIFLVGIPLWATYYYGVLSSSSAQSKWALKLNDIQSMEGRSIFKPLTISTLLLVVNLIFVLFLSVQSIYAFGGALNVEGVGASFTFAEYARKGFTELLMVTGIVSVLLSFAAVLTKKEEHIGNVFRFNYTILIIFALLVAVSGHLRLSLIEETYGYTNLRLMSHLATFIAQLYLLALLVAQFIDKPLKYLYRLFSLSVVTLLFVVMILPWDLLTAKMNYSMFKDKGSIDLPFMISRSDEALPVLLEMIDDSELSDNAKIVIKADLENRIGEIRRHSNDWRNISLTDLLYMEKIEEMVADKEYKTLAKENFDKFIHEYADLLEKGDYDKAFSQYWTENSKKSDFTELEGYILDQVVIGDDDIPAFDDWMIKINNGGSLFYSHGGNDYWNGIPVSAALNIRMTVEDYMEKYSIGTRTVKNPITQKMELQYYYKTTPTAPSYGLSRISLPSEKFEYMCGSLSDTFYAKLENGDWKIARAAQLDLGDFYDGGDISRYDFGYREQTLSSFATTKQVGGDVGYDYYDSPRWTPCDENRSVAVVVR